MEPTRRFIASKIRKAYELSSKFDFARQELTQMAIPFIEPSYRDDISCEILAGDGLVFCIENVKSNHAPDVIPIGLFFKIAKDKGEVTYDEFRRNSI